MAPPAPSVGLPLVDTVRSNQMNMMVLKRIDGQIEEILANAGHVCLYRMSVDDQQWQRKNIEGSLFLIKRRTQPRFQMLVLNKLSTDNYIETVHGGLEMETNPPYLMYTHGNDEIHGIWFYEEADLQRLSGLLQKILAQLPKPEPGAAGAPPPQAHYQPAPAPLPEPEPAAAAASPSRGGDSGGDAFWDRSVHVTEDSLPASQQLVPNSSLLSEPAGAKQQAQQGGLQGLLKAAQQKHTTSQRTPAAAAAAAAAAPTSPIPVPNSTSAPPEPAAASGSAGLLTPAFFEQQRGKQKQQQQKQAAAAGAAGSAAAAAAAAASVQQPPAGSSPATNGASGNQLQQLLSRAAKTTPSGPSPAGSGGGAGRGQPQPPLGVLPPEAIRDKLKAALIRLASNDAFVETLAAELKTVGLLQ